MARRPAHIVQTPERLERVAFSIKEVAAAAQGGAAGCTETPHIARFICR